MCAPPCSGHRRPIASKAAAILYGRVARHGFVDGDKRTGWILARRLFGRSGHRPHSPPGSPLHDLATGEIPFDALADWFRERLVRA